MRAARARVLRDPGWHAMRIGMGLVYCLMVIQGLKFFFSFGVIIALAAFGEAGL